MSKYLGENTTAQVAKVTDERTLTDILDSVLSLSKHVDDQSTTVEGYLLRDFEEDPVLESEPFTMRQKLLEIEGTLQSTTETLERIQLETDPRR